MTIQTNRSESTLPETNVAFNTDSVGDHDRNLKQESRRNKKLRLRKSDKLRRVENGFLI